MGGQYSVKNTKEIVDVALEGVRIGYAATADGKVDLNDLALLLGLVPKVAPAIQDAKVSLLELQELDAADQVELVSHVMVNLAVDEPHARRLVEKSLKAAMAVGVLVQEVVAGKDPAVPAA